MLTARSKAGGSTMAPPARSSGYPSAARRDTNAGQSGDVASPASALLSSR